MSDLHVYKGALPSDSPASAFTSIQSAINASAPGDTILVHPGHYAENLVIRTNQISLIAVGGPEATRIDPADSLRDTLEIAGADSITVTGFTLGSGTNPAKQTVHVHGVKDGTDFATHVTLSGNLIERGAGDGIKLSKVSGIVVEDNTITGGGSTESALDLVGGERITIAGNRFLDMGNIGISLKGGSKDVVVTGNTLIGVAHVGIEIGGYTNLANYMPGFLESGLTYEILNVLVENNLVQDAGNAAFRVIGGQKVAFLANTATGGNPVVKIDDSSLYHDRWASSDIGFSANSFPGADWLVDRSQQAHILSEIAGLFTDWRNIAQTPAGDRTETPAPEPESPDYNTITGTRGDNKITGSSAADEIFGEDGDDEIAAGGGDDVLHGGDDRDKLFGGAGNDQLYGGDDRDRLEGGEGDDLLVGGDGRDHLIGDSGDDVLTGGSGEATLEGGDGGDFFVFAASDGDASAMIKDYDRTEGDRIVLIGFGDELASFADVDTNGNGRLERGDVGVSTSGDRLTLRLDRILDADAPTIEIDHDGDALTAQDFLFTLG
ncbi:right-handed parallel beta-helix repeat-containing protein [Maritimibacter sp. DP1N21-5]|uniref:right-handed parallel beta-helix repeat-containing protein n=1 Tax=Maritimibacter sp. DP1N21-5 TaxID=2836867 RepID=UPI001C4804FD|nr:right-handed parallel beta-helix repeat-containing protein [Maritimibacter sp. DP1N21-5]MBV7409291.1 right-handed parallel beta-helix repeat-containing protein [Maritimibacter sp. DP1N21-5]